LPPRFGIDTDQDDFHVDTENFEAGFMNIMNLLKMVPAPLDAVVLANDSPFVQAELDRRVARHDNTVADTPQAKDW
jgi:hypothetical protein